MHYDGEPFGMYEPEERHSGLGIASFVIGIVAGVAMFAVVVVAGILEVNQPGGIDEESPEALAVGCGVLAFAAMNLLGGALGVAGLFSQHRRNVFAILGLLTNAAIVLGIVGLIVIGLTMA